MFGGKTLRERINTRLGNDSSASASESANPAAEDAADVEPDDKENVREERRLVFLLEKARNLYIEKGLNGSIELTKSFGVLYRTVSCDIDGAAEAAEVVGEEEPDEENMSRLQKLAVAGIERCVKALTKRAHVYANKPYKAGLTLTSTLYVTAPFVGLVSINISCSATVESLLAAK